MYNCPKCKADRLGGWDSRAGTCGNCGYDRQEDERQLLEIAARLGGGNAANWRVVHVTNEIKLVRDDRQN